MSMRPVLTAIAAAMVCALCVGTTLAAEERSFVLRLDTPPVTGLAREDGMVELRIDGFDTHTAGMDAPDVPTRTVLVALPPGAEPRLELRLVGARGFRDLKPLPVARSAVDGAAFDEASAASSRGVEASPAAIAERSLRRWYAPSVSEYEGEGTFPDRVAWLGATGVLRNQRYVELHLAPVRFDRSLGGLVVDSAIEVRVHFDGDYDLATAAPGDDAFEPLYREAFVNYAQGRMFRIEREGGDAGRFERATAQASAGVTGPVRKIRVREDGPVRLDHALFLAEAPEFLGTDPDHWRLMIRGEQVALDIRQLPGDDALLEPGEWVQFHGQRLDDEPATLLDYEKPAVPLENLFVVRDFTDENVYFLSIDTTPQPAMAERDATPPPVGTPEPSFVATAHAEVEDFYWPVPDALWFWMPFVSESSGPRTEVVDLPGLIPGSAEARIRVQVRGFLDCFSLAPDKKSLIGLENALLEEIVLPIGNPDNVGNRNVGEFDGNELFLHDFEWTHEGADPELTDPLRVVVDADDLPGNCPPPQSGSLKNEMLLDHIEVDYERSFVAENDRLFFRYPNGDALFEVTGLVSSAADVYEITGPSDPVRLTGVELLPDVSGHMARFRMETDLELEPDDLREFVVVGHGGIPVPAAADFEADRLSTLIADTTQADLVIIAHPDLLDSECSEGGNDCSYDADCTMSENDRCEVVAGSNLELLRSHRLSQGISSRVVRIGDLLDEFGFGLDEATAIPSFLEWLLSGGWDGPPPAYVLLLGDGSFDYKADTSNGDFVSTQMVVKNSLASTASILPYFSSDNLLAAVAGDDYLADMTVGRLAARSLGEAEGILGKILGHETNVAGGDWRSSVLLISDRGANNDFSGNEAAGFEGMNEFADSFLDGTAYTSTHLRYWTDNCQGLLGNCDAETMKQDIVNRVNGDVGDGVALVQFTGHGNFDLWSNDVIFCANESNSSCLQDDTTLLDNANKLPWLLVHNCLTGGFHSTAQKSFGEQWLKRLFGGAFAVYAPSGLGFQFIGTAVIGQVWNDVFGPHKERMIGVPVHTSQVKLCTQGSVEPCEFYTLLGDPTSRLALPDIGPAENVVATGSTGEDSYVDLDWDASASPGATYDVFRKEVPTENNYTKVNGAPIEELFYHDTDVEATRVYRYYIVADAGGFRSAWSNFNTDCGESPGPDCVQGTPLNLIAPAAPEGVAVADAENGGSVIVSWNFNSEPDIKNYVVHYGTTPSLGQTASVFGSFNQTVVTGLVNGTPYFFGVQAVNTSGTESVVSNPPIEVTPNLVLGVKSPGFIDDLVLGKAGIDAVLDWGAVTVDIYGKPASIADYEIYRGTTPLFVPAPGNLIGTTAGTSFTDTGALDDGLPEYHYLVRAVDTQGNPGGLGHQLPDGIMSLELEPSDDGIFLIWPLVTTDFDGEPTTVSHYEIWAANVPFTREDVEAEAVFVELVVPAASGPVAEIVPPAPNRYYSVLVVDPRGNRSPF